VTNCHIKVKLDCELGWRGQRPEGVKVRGGVIAIPFHDPHRKLSGTGSSHLLIF